MRYADDFVIGFEHRAEAEACLEELRARFAKFGLKLHEGKTRLIEFGRYAVANRSRRGEKRPETVTIQVASGAIERGGQGQSLRAVLSVEPEIRS